MGIVKKRLKRGQNGLGKTSRGEDKLSLGELFLGKLFTHKEYSVGGGFSLRLKVGFLALLD